MRKVQRCVFSLCFLTALLSFGQSESWLPITPQDLEAKEVPVEPGAPAIQLYYANYINDEFHSEFVYRRIKILNEKGMKYADVDIPIVPGSSITDVKARTIHPDGKIIEFTGTLLEKTIYRSQSERYLAKTFFIPDVTVGSIVEYKYLILRPEHVFYSHTWTLQHDLYTVKEEFTMRPYKRQLQTKYGGATEVGMIFLNLPATLRPKNQGGFYQMEAENIPSFQPEEFMPPRGNYLEQVRFFYEGSQISSADVFWQQVGREWNNEAEHFIGKHEEIKKAAAEAIGQEAGAEQQMRKLYARAQQIRNLTYERRRTKQELEKENLKPNTSVVDVLDRGYGTRTDIVLFFVAMARAAGFPASILYVSDRTQPFFQKNLLSRSQLSSEMASVTINGQDVFLSPGTRFCPYGQVRWMHTWTTALKLDKDGGSFVRIPASSYEQAGVQRTAALVLAEDASLSGDVTVQFLGGWALEERLDFLNADEAGKKNELEREVKSWLPPNSNVKLTRMDGWEAEDTPLIAQFHLQIPDYASVAGKHMLVPAVLFPKKQREVFKHTDRKYPVYFRYSFTEKDLINIKVPTGYAVESSPADQQVRLPYAAYQSVSKIESGGLATRRVFALNDFYFEVKRYAEIRDFYDKVQTGDEQQAALRLTDSSQKKGN